MEKIEQGTGIMTSEASPWKLAPEEQTASIFDWQELVPTGWRGVNLDSEETLIGLGKANLAAMKRYWRQRERETTRNLELAQQYADTFAGQTTESLQQRAAQYEHPEFSSVGFVSEAAPEPLDIASRTRGANATTLNFCGWCRYAHSTLNRCHYAITSYCNVMLPWQRKAYGCDGSLRSQLRLPENLFDTPCQLLCCAQGQLDLYIKALQEEVNELQAQRTKVAGYIERIIAAEKMADHKPCFASERPDGWFQDRCAVMCLVHDFSKLPAKSLPHFVPGHVTYAAKSWTVSVHSDEPLNVGRDGDAYNVNLSYSDPAVILWWEYEYLMAHPDEMAVWLAMIGETYKCSRSTLLQALHEERR